VCFGKPEKYKDRSTIKIVTHPSVVAPYVNVTKTSTQIKSFEQR